MYRINVNHDSCHQINVSMTGNACLINETEGGPRVPCISISWKWTDAFATGYCFSACFLAGPLFRRTLVIEFHHPTFQIPEMRKIATHSLSSFTFRFVYIEVISLIWFLQTWVTIYVYGTIINCSTLIKKLMQTYIVIVSGSLPRRRF